MSKKDRKFKKYLLPLLDRFTERGDRMSPSLHSEKLFCGSRLISKNVNQLWDWKTLESVDISRWKKK